MTQINLEAALNAFRYVAEARDWSQYHSPKNLATAVAVEAGELLEIFQWLDDQASAQLTASPETQAAIGAEVADILMYLIALCDETGVDMVAALNDKIADNRRRFLPEHD